MGNKIISQKLSAQWEAKFAGTQLVEKNSGFYSKTGPSALSTLFFNYQMIEKQLGPMVLFPDIISYLEQLLSNTSKMIMVITREQQEKDRADSEAHILFCFDLIHPSEELRSLPGDTSCPVPEEGC